MPIALSLRCARTVNPPTPTSAMSSMPSTAAAIDIVSGLTSLVFATVCAVVTFMVPVDRLVALIPGASNSTVTLSGFVTWPGMTRANSSSRLSGFWTMPVTFLVTPLTVQLLPIRRLKELATPLVTAIWLAVTGYAPLTRLNSGPPYGPCGSCARSSKVFKVPGIWALWFSMTSTLPQRFSRFFIWALTLAGEPENEAASCAVPSTPATGAGVLVATVEATTVAPTATVISARISSCCRHSLRSSRMAQRTTARRAGSPPFGILCAGRSVTAVALTGVAPE